VLVLLIVLVIVEFFVVEVSLHTTTIIDHLYEHEHEHDL